MKNACLIWSSVLLLGLAAILGACHRKSRTAPGAAEPTAEARASFGEGVALYDEGRYAESETAFTRAYNQSPTYKILYNIGQAQAMAGKTAIAAQTLRRYLREGGGDVPAERRREVEADIRELDGGRNRKSKKDLSRNIVPITALTPPDAGAP